MHRNSVKSRALIGTLLLRAFQKLFRWNINCKRMLFSRPISSALQKFHWNTWKNAITQASFQMNHKNFFHHSVGHERFISPGWTMRERLCYDFSHTTSAGRFLKWFSNFDLRSGKFMTRAECEFIRADLGDARAVCASLASTAFLFCA